MREIHTSDDAVRVVHVWCSDDQPSGARPEERPGPSGVFDAANRAQTLSTCQAFVALFRRSDGGSLLTTHCARLPSETVLTLQWPRPSDGAVAAAVSRILNQHYATYHARTGALDVGSRLLRMVGGGGGGGMGSSGAAAAGGARGQPSDHPHEQRLVSQLLALLERGGHRYSALRHVVSCDWAPPQQRRQQQQQQQAASVGTPAPSTTQAHENSPSAPATSSSTTSSSAKTASSSRQAASYSFSGPAASAASSSAPEQQESQHGPHEATSAVTCSAVAEASGTAAAAGAGAAARRTSTSGGGRWTRDGPASRGPPPPPGRACLVLNNGRGVCLVVAVKSLPLVKAGRKAAEVRRKEARKALIRQV